MDVIRSHSFGLKEYSSIHRHVSHYLTAENGDCFAIMSISMPIYISSVTVGYVITGDTKEMYHVKWSDFELYQQAESQPLPADYGFTFTAGR